MITLNRQSFGFSPAVINSIHSYLQNKCACTYCNRIVLNTFMTTLGVPQGSNFGPLTWKILAKLLCSWTKIGICIISTYSIQFWQSHIENSGTVWFLPKDCNTFIRASNFLLVTFIWVDQDYADCTAKCILLWANSIVWSSVQLGTTKNFQRLGFFSDNKINKLYISKVAEVFLKIFLIFIRTIQLKKLLLWNIIEYVDRRITIRSLYCWHARSWFFMHENYKFCGWRKSIEVQYRHLY